VKDHHARDDLAGFVADRRPGHVNPAARFEEAVADDHLRFGRLFAGEGAQEGQLFVRERRGAIGPEDAEGLRQIAAVNLRGATGELVRGVVVDGKLPVGCHGDDAGGQRVDHRAVQLLRLFLLGHVVRLAVRPDRAVVVALED
jgi:hypothetical protein